jgi:hypothetical protein
VSVSPRGQPRNPSTGVVRLPSADAFLLRFLGLSIHSEGIALTEHAKPGLERLLFRRQYLLTPQRVEGFPTWKVLKIRDNLWLTAHPDLLTSQVKAENKSLTLLGFLLDPENTQATDAQILDSLFLTLCRSQDSLDFIEATSRFGGRWNLVIDDGKEVLLLTDPLAMRQAFYTQPLGSSTAWCASQPGLLGELLCLTPDPESMSFMEKYRVVYSDYWWPGDMTAYRQVKALLPNHYLNLSTGIVHRFWPNKGPKKVALRTAVENGARLLEGIMQAAGHRFGLSLLMTAGWDSRLVLAATRNVASQISYITFLFSDMTEQTADVCVPARLLEGVGRQHTVLRIPKEMSPEFRDIYMRNMSLAHPTWGSIAESMYDSWQPQSVRVSGSGSEVGRFNYSYATNYAEEVTPALLARLAHMPPMPPGSCALRALEAWLSDAQPDRGYHLIDLFFWEQDLPRWMSSGQVEWDIAHDCFTPYNCRSLLVEFLGVNGAYRRAPRYQMYRALIARLWPELLAEPINPHKKLYREKWNLKFAIKDALVRNQLLDYVPSSLINLGKKLIPDQ